MRAHGICGSLKRKLLRFGMLRACSMLSPQSSAAAAKQSFRPILASELKNDLPQAKTTHTVRLRDVILHLAITETEKLYSIDLADIASVTYNGKEQGPELMYNGKVLTEGTDYKWMLAGDSGSCVNAGSYDIFLFGRDSSLVPFRRPIPSRRRRSLLRSHSPNLLIPTTAKSGNRG